jgi:hypothetical protein
VTVVEEEEEEEEEDDDDDDDHTSYANFVDEFYLAATNIIMQ